MHTGQLLHRLVGPQEDLNRLAVTRHRRMADGGFRDHSPVDLRGKTPGGPEFRHDRLAVSSVHVGSVTATPSWSVVRVRIRGHVFG